MQRPNPIQGVMQTVRRPLKIFATDPLLGRTFGNRARIDVANENLQPGPMGPRVEVIDYDGAGDCFYEAVDLLEALEQKHAHLARSDKDGSAPTNEGGFQVEPGVVVEARIPIG